MNAADRLDNECLSPNNVKEYLLMLGLGLAALGKPAMDQGSSGAGCWPRLVGPIHVLDSPPLSLLLLAHFFVFNLFCEAVGDENQPYGSKSWNVTPLVIKHLKGFHTSTVMCMAWEHKPQQQPEGTWT